MRARLPEGQVLTWAEFSEKFKKAHIPTALIRRMKDEFRHLKQGGMTVVGYLDRFTQLSRYAPEEVDTEEKRKDHFMVGLHDELQVVLVAMQFPDLESLADASIMMEGKLKMASENRKRRMMQQGGSSNPRLRPTQPPRPAPQPQRSPYPAPRPSAPARPGGVPHPAGGVPRDPTSEVICFKCGQKGHNAVTCTNKANAAPRPNAPAPSRGNPGRNNAQHGVPNAGKGRLNHVQAEEALEAADVILGMFPVNSVPAQVLFDSGASHSFVTKTFVDRSKLSPSEMRRPMIVQIPGSKTRSSLACSGVSIAIHGVEF